MIRFTKNFNSGMRMVRFESKEDAFSVIYKAKPELNDRIGRNDVKLLEIEVGYGGDCNMSLCHELGHWLHYRYINFCRPMKPKVQTAMNQFRIELIAWRVAKSIMKAKWWKEDDAIHSLQSYESMKHMPLIDWDKFKIIPWR